MLVSVLSIFLNDMPLLSIVSLNHYNKLMERGKVTNSSWFAGDFPILALKSHGSRTALVPGKPKCLVILERGFTWTNLLNKEFDSAH